MSEEVKTKRSKRRSDEVFRRDAVALVESTGKPLAEIAQQLGVTHWNLRDWLPIYGKKAGRPATVQGLEAQLQRLLVDNASLRAQRDVLKKALGILAEPNGSDSRK